MDTYLVSLSRHTENQYGNFKQAPSENRIRCLLPMSSNAVTLERLQRLSNEGRTDELQNAIAACKCSTLRTLCQDVGLRVRRRKYEAYQSKAGYSQLLTKKLGTKTVIKRRDTTTVLSPPPPSKKQSYLHLLHLILAEVIPPPLLEEILSLKGGITAHRKSTELWKTRAKAPRKMMRATSVASVEKAGRLLKELFPTGSRAATMVSAELARSVEWLASAVQREEDEEDSP